MKILDNKKMINTVKSFRKVNECKNNSMGLEVVNIDMNEMEEANEVVADGCTFEATAIGRIKIWLHNWH